MQNLVKIFLFLLLTSVCFGESYYYFHETKQDLQQNYSKLSVRFKTNTSDSEKLAFTKKFSELVPFNESFKLIPYHKNPKECELIEQCVIELTKNFSENEIKNLILKLNRETVVELAEPVFKTENSDFYLYGKLVVRFEASVNFGEIQKIAQKFGLKITEQRIWNENIYFFELNKTSKLSSLEVANQIFETEKVVYSLPDFIQTNWQDDPNDPFFPNQWFLKNDGSPAQFNGIPGVDLNVLQAWTISQGDSSVLVAIIDSGVDYTNPDLAGQTVQGYDFADNDSDPFPSSGDAHGTSCSGIVVAKSNNGTGVSGVAPNCRVMPMRVSLTSSSASTQTRALAIHAAADSGASVISCSWQTGGIFYQFLEDAIIYAKLTGRNGLGCVLSWSSGNTDVGVLPWPKSMAQVMAVGGISMCDERKTATSCDGENWGVTYGDSLDVSAPCVKIYTTDISGASGYSSGDYTATFNGTSSACPQGAASAALVISVAPWLTSDEVQNVLEKSCSKPANYVFTNGYENGSKNIELGYGRINTYQALLLALTGKVTGTVTDVFGNPLSDVIVSNPLKFTLTDTNGFYLLQTNPGIQAVSFAKLGYETLTLNLNVLANDTLQVDTSLVASAFGTLSGTVVDEITLLGISAEVQLNYTLTGIPMFLETVTDSLGNFTFTQLSPNQTSLISYNSVKLTPNLNYSEKIFTDSLMILAGTATQKTYALSRIDVLLVADGNGIEQAYKTVFDSLGIKFSVWNVSEKGEIPFSTLNSLLNRNVIWTTGYENQNTLSANEIFNLWLFVVTDGNLFLSGLNIANDLANTQFLQTYFGANYDSMGITNSFLKEISTNPFGNSKIYNTSQPDQTQRDAFSVTDGTVVAKYGTAGILGNAIVSKETSSYKNIITGFESSGITTLNGNPNLTPFDTLLFKIYSWWKAPSEANTNFNNLKNYTLSQNFPNPFNPGTEIIFILPKREKAKLVVYNILGQVVRTLFDEVGKFGKNSVFWNGTDERGNLVSSGIYFYQLKAENFSETKKMILLK
ncbi:S8 family serine peptidase [bacterium]|nr:S8 family serine peptidase [bacterium]